LRTCAALEKPHEFTFRIPHGTRAVLLRLFDQSIPDPRARVEIDCATAAL
jgi:hypothetical protein